MTSTPRPLSRQSIAIVNGGTDMVDVLESAVDPGAYDVCFVPLGPRTQGRIRHLEPDLIVLCTRIEEQAGFQLLTMLKLDPATRDIPVMTFTTEHEGRDDVASAFQLLEDELGYPTLRPSLRMN